MAKIWYSSKELTEIDGLPSTIQGINRKARVEGWKSRKRSGVQGKAIEYHFDSLPDFVKSHLIHAQEFPAAYTITPVEPLQLWTSAFLRLKSDEQEAVMVWLMRNGVKELVSFVKEQADTENE
ncbi:Mu DNA-binding protein [Orbus hercynius]|uniref:Mu DNA-binding protein n=1 Tax=Orbus hercynius TaxID=593135 RepID=A0A495RB58_9GAMM|nr:DNA-binding protein [Orbus hercynius]RKS84717.1 Mu DNA-binding protein [Orbus hercynius]